MKLKKDTLPEYRMFQPSEWVCPNYNLDVVGQTNPGKVNKEYMMGAEKK